MSEANRLADALPPLPKNKHAIADLEGESPDLLLYTADQMRAYALEALRTQVAALAEREWRPIETAPKGCTVLVGYTNRAGKWRTVRGHYYLPQTLELSDAYDGDDGEDGYAPEGWYEEADNAETINFTDSEPTHWQPLPAPPLAAAPSPNKEQP